MGINIGALLAAIVAGSASAMYGWKAGFLTAGIGMIISLITQFIFAGRLLGDVGTRPAACITAERNLSGKQRTFN